MNVVKRILLVVGVIFLGAILVFLNQGLKKSAAPDVDEDEQAQQSKAVAVKTPPPPIDPKTVLAADETVGNPAKAIHRIQAGWVYDENNQKKPETLAIAIQRIHYYVEKSGGIASAEIVDLDVPAEDRTPAAQGVTKLGISVDGVPVSSGNLSGEPFPDESLLRALKEPPKR